MDNKRRVSVSQRLAIEKQLLREEKFIVNALKMVKEERFALQREGTDLLCRLKELLRQGKPNLKDEGERIEISVEDCPAPMIPGSSLLEDFGVPGAGLDEVVNNEVELNLTVPTHNFYDQMPEEEYEEMETEDDYEIEMSMLMDAGEKPNS